MIDAVVIGPGQAGLAAAHALRHAGLAPVVLEAGAEPVGSWPAYHDSLVLFSPARYSSLPGMPFPGDPDHYSHRDEVIDHLRRYAERLADDPTCPASTPRSSSPPPATPSPARAALRRLP